MLPLSIPDPTRPRRSHRPLLAAAILVVLLAAFAGPLLQARSGAPGLSALVEETNPVHTPTSSPTPVQDPQAFNHPPQQDLPSISASPSPLPSAPLTSISLPPANPALPFSSLETGLIILSMDEGGYQRLFAYRPVSLPFTRLTAGAWNDINPAFSPDGSQLAFASDRDGDWDLYLLDLSTGAIDQITDTPQYEASPAWSPDGLWLAHEYYDQEGGGLDIFIRPLDGTQPPIRLTDSPGADYAPAWSPLGRQIAFISDRSGEADVWLADLDDTDERFRNLSRNSGATEEHPAWSPDGSWLGWASSSPDGVWSLLAWPNGSAGNETAGLRSLGSGEWFAWSPDGGVIVATQPTPNRSFLSGFDQQTAGLALPAVALTGPSAGLTWGQGNLLAGLPEPLAQAALFEPAPLWTPLLSSASDLPLGRQQLVPLAGVEAPNPVLQDRVDESFAALRQAVGQRTGWDFLADLENAYVPLTSPMPPGMGVDWLYTGRAFAFNPLPIHAGWVTVLREGYGAQTYWRIFLRTRFQDGSQGRPLRGLPWDLNARFSGDPQAYERGGRLAESSPPGYWVDFTELAAAYGWERQPALSTWRLSYPTARINEFALTEGLDWHTAMLEVYPAEALSTPTAAPSPTLTPTATTPPTMTPVPTRTPRPTVTPRPTRTPVASPTPTGPAAP